jgi:glutaredoxin 3
VQLILYTWSTCSFCARAKALLEERGIEYLERPIDGDRVTSKRLATLFGRHVMPFVLLDGEPLGGVEELEALLTGADREVE